MTGHNSEDATSTHQFTLFKDALARRVLAEPDIEGSSAGQDNADTLDDFTSYLSEEAWSTLPAPLREATHETRDNIPDVDSELDLPLNTLPASFGDTLSSCGLIPPDDPDATQAFLRRVLRDYVAEACAPPPM